MGTDIHIQVWGKDPTTGEWEPSIIKPFPRWGESAHDWDVDPTGRNYRVFGLLAGVRNGTGFGGVKTGEPVEPFFPRRGLPYFVG